MDTLRAAFDDSFMAQLIVTPKGDIIEANHRACRTLCYTKKELLGFNHEDIVADDHIAILEGLAERFEKESLQNSQLELRYLKKDNKFLWASVSVSAIKVGGSVKGLLLQIQDISEQKKAEAALLQNTQDLDQFIYIASHDLREPLTAIAGFASLIKKRYSKQLEDNGIQFLQEVIDAAKRMEIKIDDLLAFSRAGRNVCEATFPLGAAIEEAKKSLVCHIERTKTSFQIQNELPVVCGDRSLIAQVFQNLFSNSIKYCGESPPVIKITTEVQEGNNCVVSVQDNGVGFDIRHKDRIFGVFQRLYTVEQYPGTGIGLAIAKKIIERHQGEIWADSKPGAGSTFYFTLQLT